MTKTESKFLELLASSSHPLLADGAMGTMLHGHGVGFDQCFDALNLTDPAIVGEIHRAYIEAGAQVIFSNTFGANRYKLSEHGLENQVEEINRAGVELARRVVEGTFKDVLVAGDVGPLGVRLAPYGRVQPEQAREIYTEQISALCAAGIDFLVIETFSDLYEIREAVAAAREFCTLPIVATVTFTRDDRTLLGDTPTKVARTLHETGADVIGANCSGGPAQLKRILEEMRAAVPEAIFSIKPNAGWPEHVGGRVMYSASPDYFGEYLGAFAELGVKMIGGCCGTTPEHIAAMRSKIKALPKDFSIQDVHFTEEIVHADFAPKEDTQLAKKLKADQFAISVEMDPPRGLSAHKILAGASLLAEAGADVINVADSPMARMRMSPWAVCNLIQRNVNVETTLHFPTRGRNLLKLQGDLLAAHALDIRNVFVVMGDPTSIGDYPDAMDDYDLAPSGLIKLIKQRFNTGVDHAGSNIGQPTSFFVGCALNLLPSNPEREIKVLRRKINNGADFALTQPIYQPDKALEFLNLYADEFGKLEIPILAGVLPLYGTRHAAFLHNEVPGIIIPDETFTRLETAGDAAPQEGVRIAIEDIQKMKAWAQGIYIMPSFSRYDLVAEIIEAVKE
ncbi:MAG: bifunctional homocysteine S-methyltransferase/methylenetetrahydrofolate reductase [Anaerolineales bacterium]|nr:bifunctional homocysteine S-methyltransferase/methylenetetrahydrofolate reductase [Chloroflexota bacterium]MBL6981545.1 bifunctional homocysteine S-methyltransferase/methylenetetrahydrofolate reductase [Anaerolineales bacterium]